MRGGRHTLSGLLERANLNQKSLESTADIFRDGLYRIKLQRAVMMVVFPVKILCPNDL
jgi:hypothetical protein